MGVDRSSQPKGHFRFFFSLRVLTSFGEKPPPFSITQQKRKKHIDRMECCYMFVSSSSEEKERALESTELFRVPKDNQLFSSSKKKKKKKRRKRVETPGACVCSRQLV